MTPGGGGRTHQVAPRALGASPHPAPQLVQLGDAEPVGVEDHHHRGVGDVDADLDHGGGHEHVETAIAEEPHRLLLLRRRDPAVEQTHPQALQLAGGEGRGVTLGALQHPFGAVVSAGRTHGFAAASVRSW